MLKVLAIFLGILIIGTRGLILLVPGRAKVVMTDMASNTALLRGIGGFLLIFSILVFGAVRSSAATAIFVMSIIGGLMFAGGLWLIFLPVQYGNVVKLFMRLPDPVLRVLAGFGVCLGVLILVLGIRYY
jgi:hypothetical protein